MVSQSQNPKFRTNLENFHPCYGYSSQWRCTKHETCTILHRFHVLYISYKGNSKTELSHAFLEVTV